MKKYVAPSINVITSEDSAKRAAEIVRTLRNRQAKKVNKAYTDLGSSVTVFTDTLLNEHCSEELKNELLFVAVDTVVGSALRVIEAIKKVYPRYFDREGKRI